MELAGLEPARSLASALPPLLDQGFKVVGAN
jgi:hypothetical protein